MNEKFFDLKKEKQDRMINASLKIFALNGYKHASTDDIVTEAGISKGLLFHYFGSKLGLYTFLYDYSVKFMKLELTRGVDEKTVDYFEIRKQIELAKLQILKNYPYMQQFLDRSTSENVKEALLATEDLRNVLPDVYADIFRRADRSLFAENVDPGKLNTMLEYTVKGLMAEQSEKLSFNPDLLYEEISDYLMMMKKLVYHKSNKN
ncbi:MAG: TetR/AcrR family transcriptional regulator [Lachnospiraceae bacterium]|nr:TetR/AcrR family transcriptional regulator [Lachnospiraceae bacterium]